MKGIENIMKFKTTQKAIKDNFKNVVRVGYCDLQSLLNFENPIAYTTRREGWGCDIYDFGINAISTGYAPFGNVKTSYNLCKKYEDEAEKILYNISDYQKRKEQLHELALQFINEAIKDGKK